MSYVIKNSAGLDTTVKSITLGAGAGELSQSVPSDNTGNPIFTSSSPGFVTASPAGASNFTPFQANPTISASLIIAARTGRQSVVIINSGTTPVYLGGGSVTTSNGVLLPGILGASIEISTTAVIYGIVGSGTQNVTGYELY